MIVIRPLSIGEIFDRAVTLLVRRWRAALVLGLLTALPAGLQKLVATYGQGGVLGFGVLLQLVGTLMTVYGGAAFALLAAGAADRPDPLRLLRAVLARFWGLFGTSLLSGFLIIVVGGIAFAVAAACARSFGPVAGLVIGLVLFVAVAPLLFAFELAFTVAVLEGSGGSTAVSAAWERVYRDDRRRTWLLSVAVLASYFVPIVVLEYAGAALAPMPGLAWAPVLTSLVESAGAVAFLNTILAVASVDYRVRQEGLDLEAAIEASPADEAPA